MCGRYVGQAARRWQATPHYIHLIALAAVHPSLRLSNSLACLLKLGSQQQGGGPQKQNKGRRRGRALAAEHVAIFALPQTRTVTVCKTDAMAAV